MQGPPVQVAELGGPRGSLGLQLTLLPPGTDADADPTPFPQPPLTHHAQDPVASSAGVTRIPHNLDKPGLPLYSL